MNPLLAHVRAFVRRWMTAKQPRSSGDRFHTYRDADPVRWANHPSVWRPEQAQLGEWTQEDEDRFLRITRAENVRTLRRAFGEDT